MYRSIALLLFVMGVAEPAAAELPVIVRRLPATDVQESISHPPNDDSPTFRLAVDPPEYRTPEEVLAQQPHLVAHKNGFFQKLSLTGTEILRDGSDGVGIFETELFAAFAVPAPTTETPLLLIPSLQIHSLDAPTISQLPSTLYASYFDFMWLPKVGDRLRGMVSIAPGWYSDFDGQSGDGFRWTGRGIARYDWLPDRLQLVLGVLYLNRLHTRLLPVGGMIWKPNDDWNYELVFPKAQIARRIGWGPGLENWLYLAGGFGGNTWSVARPAGGGQTLDMIDWRLMAGWEQKRNGGAGCRVEVGYVFLREVEFTSPATEFKPDDTVLLRGVVAF